MDCTIKISGVLKTVVILSSLLGLDQMYLITKAPLYQIFSKLYAGCLVIFTIIFYVITYLQTGSILRFIAEYVSALEYCVLAVLKLLRSKETWIDFLQNIREVDSSLKVKCHDGSKMNINSYLSKSCFVLSIILPVIVPAISWLNFNKTIPTPSVIFLLLSAVHDIELIFIGNMMMMIETRILCVNAHLKKRLADSENKSSEDIIQLEATKRTELDTHDVYQIYVKVFNSYEILKKNMNFTVTAIMVSTFAITHLTFVDFTRYVNTNGYVKDSNVCMHLFLGVSVLKCIAGLATLGVLGSRTASAGATVPHVLADLLTDHQLEKAERRRLKGFLRSCAERPFHYALCGVVPLDVTLPVNFVALSVSYIVIGSQFTRMDVFHDITAKDVRIDTIIKADMDENITINGVLKTVVIISSLLGLDRMYLITKAPPYLIISKLYAGCLVIFTIVFYVTNYLQTDSRFPFIEEYVSALQYCLLAVLKLLKSKETWIGFFQNIREVDALFKGKLHDDSYKNTKLFLSIACLVQSIIFPAIWWLRFNQMIPLPSAIFFLLSAVNDIELVFIGNLMMMVETRILFVNSHLNKRLADPEDNSSEDIIQLATAIRTELNTYDVNQIYVKVFNCYEILTKYMNFPITVFMVSTFIITHFTFVGFSEYANSLVMDSKACMHLILGVSGLKCIAGLAILGFLGSRTGSAAATVPHVLADILADVNLEKAERRPLKGFLRSCAERPFHYALYGVVPLDVSLPVNFVALSVSYIIIGSQFVKLVLAAHSNKSGP